MRHAARGDLPHLCRSKPGLDVDAAHVMGLAVDAQAGKFAGLARPLPAANPAVEQELAAADGLFRVGGGGLDQAGRNLLHHGRCRRRLETHDRHESGRIILRYRAKDAHSPVGTGLEHHGFAVTEVDEDFEALGGRNPQQFRRDRLRQKAGIRRDDVKLTPVAEAQLEILRVGGVEDSQAHPDLREFWRRDPPRRWR